MFARYLPVSRGARDVVTMMFANCHKPLDHHRSRLRPSLAAQSGCLKHRRLAQPRVRVGWKTSRVPPRWHRNPSRVCIPSPRCIGLSRAWTSGLRNSAHVPSQPASCSRRRQAQEGRKGLGIISCRLVPAFDLPLGPWSQKLDRIGASGIMVIRIPMWSAARSALAWLQRRTGRGNPAHFPTHWEHLFFTLRRSRGATGRYQGPTGAPSTAPRRSRRRRTVPTPFPGEGRGLNL